LHLACYRENEVTLVGRESVAFELSDQAVLPGRVALEGAKAIFPKPVVSVHGKCMNA
jgi:hypothetical protein